MSHHRYHYRPPRADNFLLKFAPRMFASAEPLPPTVDLRAFCLPIRDQGQEGACSAFASAAFREVSHAVASGGPAQFRSAADYLSPAYLYARTRMKDRTFPKDSGASIADEFAELQNVGICPEALLPYNQDPGEAPTPQCDVAALPFRLAQPLYVNNDAISIKSALAAQQAVVIGFTVYDSFEDCDSTGVLPMPDPSTEEMLGGHGVLIVGYREDGFWIIRNQWGTSWGDGGYCYAPYLYTQLFMECWTGIATL